MILYYRIVSNTNVKELSTKSQIKEEEKKKKIKKGFAYNRRACLLMLLEDKTQIKVKIKSRIESERMNASPLT
jgi:hypothetical protein